MHDLAIAVCGALGGIGIILLIVSMYRVSVALDGWPEKRPRISDLARVRSVGLIATAALAGSLALTISTGLSAMPVIMTAGAALAAAVHLLGILVVLKLEDRNDRS